MDLSNCTPGQRQAIETLDHPLMVSAGAGSGKTFTLTQRIVGALLPRDGKAPFLQDVGQVLAITFTKKAAAELRDRVKGALLQEGLAEQAALADDAWISTIHGMASRILRENALELGLDPAFTVIEGAQADALKRAAANNVVEAARAGTLGPTMEAFLASGRVFGSGRGSGLVDEAFALASRVQGVPGGFDALVIPRPAQTPHQIIRALFEQGLEFKGAVAGWGSKLLKAEEAAAAAIDDALDGAQFYLSDDPDLPFDDPGFNEEAFLDALFAFPVTSAKFHAKKPDAAFFEEWRALCGRLFEAAQEGLALRPSLDLLRFAQALDQEHARLKGPSRLDNDDLLSLLVRALDEHPALAQRYRSRFKLIMIDEFQDTDQMQLKAISALAAPDLSNLATVGDAQQSIYRFRGADVNVFFDFRTLLRQDASARFVELPHNFRSHADVLAAVERVFEQPHAFGEDFLKLEPSGAVNGEPDPLFDGPEGLPRISGTVVHGRGNMAAAREANAQAVARRFAQLRERGAHPGDMVLLLGGMTNVQVYLNQLRAEGFDTMVSGGSVFAQQPDVATVESALHLAANPLHDTLSLYQVLASPWFACSDDVLLALCKRRDDQGEPRTISLAQGFWRGSPLEPELSHDDRMQLDVARASLGAFVDGCRRHDPVTALRDLLAASGRLLRLQQEGAEGIAQAANAFKALDVVAGLARETDGPASMACAFSSYLANSKEAPGALSLLDSDCVRVMTVHASKGLEFPHVALAELGTGAGRAASLLIENRGSHAFLFRRPSFTRTRFDKPAGAWRKNASAVRALEAEQGPLDETNPSDILSRPDIEPAGLSGVLARFKESQELAEALRLLYVGMTRASRSLFLGYASKENVLSYDGAGIYKVVHDALRWSADAGAQLLEYGGSAPACFQVKVIEAEKEDEARGAEGAGDANGTEAASAGEPYPGAATVDAQDAVLADGGRTDHQDETAADPFPLPGPACRRERVAPEPRQLVARDTFAYSSLSHGPVGASPSIAALAGEADATAPSPDETVALDGTKLPNGGVQEVQPPCFNEQNDGADQAFSQPDDPESATALGSAFHLLCERAIRQANAAGTPTLPVPDRSACDAQARAFRLSASQRERLDVAVERWFASDECRRFAACAHRDAEATFLLELPGSEPTLFLEGSIDALGHDDDGCAVFFDYKTGGSDDETPQQLHGKHLLQAQCYAYALLRDGFDEVEAVFVRVEREDPQRPGQPQTVRYRFFAADADRLGEAIRAAVPPTETGEGSHAL